MRRRRANVLFVLGLISACALFLAATTKTDALYYVFGATFGVMCACTSTSSDSVASVSWPPCRSRRWCPGPGDASMSGASATPHRRLVIGARAPDDGAASPPLLARRLSPRHPSPRQRHLTVTLAPAGAVAQLVERNNRTVEARGSIPLSSTVFVWARLATKLLASPAELAVAVTGVSGLA